MFTGEEDSTLGHTRGLVWFEEKSKIVAPIIQCGTERRACTTARQAAGRQDEEFLTLLLATRLNPSRDLFFVVYCCVAGSGALPRGVDLCLGRGPFGHRDPPEPSPGGSGADKAADHTIGLSLVYLISRGDLVERA